VIQPTPALTGQGGLAGVSCLSAADCTAFGTQTGQQVGHRPLIEHWDGTSWAVQPTPVPKHGTATFAGLARVSCLSATYCTAVGSYNRAQPLADHE
jgi:hypothetical protein